MRHAPPDRLTVDVGELTPGGRALAHMEDGTPLFVDGAWPGERVRVEVHRRHARVAEGRVIRVVRPSPDRVDPPCPHAGTCGGCDWMALDVAAQRRAKARLVVQAQRRQAGRDVAPPPVVPSPADLRYRGRVRLHVDLRGRIGPFARGSHRVVEIDRCPVARDAIGDALDALRSAVRPLGPALGRQVSGVAIHAGDGTPPWAIQLFMRHRRSRPSRVLAAALRSLAGAGGAVWVNGQVLHGAPFLRLPLPGGTTLRAGPTTFVQANPGANGDLVRAVVERVAGGGTFLDLFCGAGNFTLPLLAAGIDGVGVEISPGAVSDARAAAEEHGLPPSAFIQGRVGTDPDTLLSQHPSPVVILDPPRTGARDVMPAIAAARPRRVIYVGCDPVTQARDLRALFDAGYELDPAVGAPLLALDLFPHTHHVETVATLRPRPE